MSVSRETLGGSSCADPEVVSRETTPTCRHHVRTSPFAYVLLLPIRAYRRFLSPALKPRCRYYPSCSAYAEESIRELGAFRGTTLAAWRVLRCNPFSEGGIDPFVERRFFRDNRQGERTETA